MSPFPVSSSNWRLIRAARVFIPPRVNLPPFVVRLKTCAAMSLSLSSARTTKRFPSRDAVIRFYDAVGNVIETHDHKAISRCGKEVAQTIA